MNTATRTLVATTIAAASALLPITAAHAGAARTTHGPTGAAQAAPLGSERPVGVIGDGSHVQIDQASVFAGRVSFRVSSTNTIGGRSNIALLRHAERRVLVRARLRAPVRDADG